MKASKAKKPEIMNSHTLKKVVILCLMPFICCIVFRTAKLTGESNMKIFMRMALMAETAYALYLAYKKKLTADKVIMLILIAGCILRIGYTMYTHAFTRSHDMGANDETGVGHWGYVYNLLNGHLPQSNENQFYHPPLYHFISSILVRAMMILKNKDAWGGLEYIPQLVSCTCSIVVMITLVKIMNELKIKKSVQIIPILITAVYPEQIMTSGRFNNDSMAQMFTVLALYFTLLWHNKPTMKYIIGIAITIGCGMMTKMNCALTAFVAGPVMIYHFVKAIRTKDKTVIKDIITQFAVFAVICFPLGLWYGIRNYIKFGQPLNYVYKIPTSMALYMGDEPFWARWGLFSPLDFYERPFSYPGEDANVWMGILKTGMHGEFTWDKLSTFLVSALDYINVLTWISVAAAAIITMFFNKGIDKTQKYSVFYVWGLFGLSIIMFNISYPYGCTVNFRYALTVQIAASILWAYMCEYLYDNKKKNSCRYGFTASMTLIGVFAALCVMHFC